MDLPFDGELEQTLVLLKPDAITRGLTGRILSRFEDAQLQITATKMVMMDKVFTRLHYADLEERYGPEIYQTAESYMLTGPVMALILTGIGAVGIVRKIIGPTYPDDAPPGTIRGDFAHQSRAHAIARGVAVANLVHASANPEEAKREIDLWFSADEIFCRPARFGLFMHDLVRQ